LGKWGAKEQTRTGEKLREKEGGKKLCNRQTPKKKGKRTKKFRAGLQPGRFNAEFDFLVGDRKTEEYAREFGRVEKAVDSRIVLKA